MAIVLAQSVLGTHATGTYNNLGGTVTITAGPVTTSAGSFLVMVGYTSAQATVNAVETVSPNAPTGGAGLTWRGAYTGSFLSGTTNRGGAAIFWVGNAPAQTSVTFSMLVGAGGGTSGSTGSFVGECAFYEFTGVAASNNQTLGGPILDAQGQLLSQTSGTPHTANLTTSLTDLIIVASAATGSALSAGSGYTLGLSTTALSGVIGQLQYALNVAAGSIATSYLSGTPANWGAVSLALKPPPATGNNSYGFFFG